MEHWVHNNDRVHEGRGDFLCQSEGHKIYKRILVKAYLPGTMCWLCKGSFIVLSLAFLGLDSLLDE